ncbi:MAG: hypothetical protein H6605_00310 [Flavobacteriales bacterium]|nr:hypothetical protein [Flavobacteriales bacterium]
MKNKITFIALAMLLAFFSSCEKDEGKLPNISFKNGGNYVSDNKDVSMGDTVLIGINASKSEDKDVLKTFDASVSFDGAASSSFKSESLSGSDEDNMSRDLTIITRNQAGTELYTFTVINRDGLKNQVSLTLTVK